MALVTGDMVTGIPAIPPVRGRWWNVKPCGTAAARRRHFRRGEPQDDQCRAFHARDMAQRRAARHRNLWHKPVRLGPGDQDLFDLYPMEEVA